jgi:hypothetical protein
LWWIKWQWDKFSTRNLWLFLPEKKGLNLGILKKECSFGNQGLLDRKILPHFKVLISFTSNLWLDMTRYMKYWEILHAVMPFLFQ